MNDDTRLVYEVLANDETLYKDCEAAARYAAAVSDTVEEFIDELADELLRITEDNRELMMFSKTEYAELDLVDYRELASEYEYDDYK